MNEKIEQLAIQIVKLRTQLKEEGMKVNPDLIKEIPEMKSASVPLKLRLSGGIPWAL